MPENHALFVFAPTADQHDRFFNCYPGSILHAIAPTIDEITHGELRLSCAPLLFHPKILKPDTLDNYRELLLHEKPTILAVSSTYDSWHVALKLAKVTRELLPSTAIIHGGPHLDEVLEPWVIKRMSQLCPFANSSHASYIDFAVGGDGEHALLYLIRSIITDGVSDTKRRLLSEPLPILGKGVIAFEHCDDVHHVRFRQPMNLDDLPFVPRHLLPVSSLFDFDCFREIDGSRIETVTMITHRGCKARCNFCSEGLPYEQRSLTHIAAEVRELAEMGVRAVFLDDSTIQDNPQFLDLFHVLSRSGLEIGALTRFDYLQDPELVQEMKDAGLTYLYAAIEQFDDDALQAMNKKLSTEEIGIGLSNLKRSGIRVGVSTLFGLPYESQRSISKTIEFVSSQVAAGSIDYVSMSLFSFHPRTPLGSKHRELFQTIDYSIGPPNLRHPYTEFEEGSWYHPPPCHGFLRRGSGSASKRFLRTCACS